MREIKFRVWDGHQMLYEIEDITQGCLNDFANGLMQYTGLKDKNGKEIYEGDIMDARPECGGIHAVKFLYEHHIIGLGIDCSGCMGMEHMEIIGNVYENPDILKT